MVEPAAKSLYLIDGHAQFFRAYHAIRSGLTSPVTKEPTNMTFGFVGMLLKVLRQYKPDYLAVVIDAAGDKETFRSDIYPEYKANRSPAPEDLRPQIDRCLAILKTMGVPVLAIPRVEADDVIATVVRRMQREQPDLRIRIVSKDKDLTQLLNHNVELFDVHKDQAVTAAETFDTPGLEPRHVIDVLTLMGDKIDNVPGVPGIGPKTAGQLIMQYGSIENMLANLHEIKGKKRENIEAARATLPLTRSLISLKEDVEVDFDLEQARCIPCELPLEQLLGTLRELGFGRYQDELRAVAGVGASSATPPPSSHFFEGARQEPGEKELRAAPFMTGTANRSRSSDSASPMGERASKAASPLEGGLFSHLDQDEGVHDAAEPSASNAVNERPGKYECVNTIARLDAIIAQIKAVGECALDTETTGLSPINDELAGICLSVQAGSGMYVPVRSPDCGSHLDEAVVIARLRPILEDPAIAKIGHNLKFDLNVLRKAGVNVRGRLFDTMVASYLIDAARSSHSMDVLALALLNHTNIPITDLIGAGRNQRTFITVPLDRATEYAAEDADITLRLRDAMAPQLEAMGLRSLFDDVEMPLVTVLAEVEWNGIRVDPEELDRQREKLESRVSALRRELQDKAPFPFSPDSPKQLAALLFNKPTQEPPGLGLKVIKRGKTGPSTDQEVLDKLAGDPAIDSPIPRLIVEYRQLTKLVNTYLVALKEAINPRTHRIHSSFNQTVAVTGRLSSNDPNLQNIPIRTEVGREIRRAFVAEKSQDNWLNQAGGTGQTRGITAETQRAQSGMGELSASSPNQSPAPRSLRLCGELPEEPNVLITADYSQIELRILAHLSEDAALIEAFHQGLDIHTAVAAEVFGVTVEDVTKSQRASAKMVNFGIVYGVTAFGLARRLQMAGTDTTNEQAARIIADYKARYIGIAAFLDRCVQQAMEYGYVETILKRRRLIPQVHANNPQQRALGERLAINTVVQGSAADLIKVAMIDIERCLKAAREGDRRCATTPTHCNAWASGTSDDEREFLARTRLILQIHDELVFEAPQSVAEPVMAFVQHRMQQAMTLKVPLVAGGAWSSNWIDAK